LVEAEDVSHEEVRYQVLVAEGAVALVIKIT
jgi:hypothetical protein